MNRDARARRRWPAAERRAAVLAAASIEFAVGGLAGTSTQDIADRAGISQPYVFQLFATKQELFLACCQDAFERIRSAFTAAADGADEPLVEMAAAYLELLGDRTSLMIQMHAYTASSDPIVRDAVRREFGALVQAVADLGGADPRQARDFIAQGLLLNVWASLDLAELTTTEPWAMWLATGSSVEGIEQAPGDELDRP
jgi:AcrR family transcriptional regulator